MFKLRNVSPIDLKMKLYICALILMAAIIGSEGEERAGCPGPDCGGQQERVGCPGPGCGAGEERVGCAGPDCGGQARAGCAGPGCEGNERGGCAGPDCGRK